MAEEGFRIETGMRAVDTDGRELGKVNAIWSEDESNVSRFLTIDGHLVPVEAIADAEGDRLELDLEDAKIDDFPNTGDDEPSQDLQRQAYEALGLEGPIVEE